MEYSAKVVQGLENCPQAAEIRKAVFVEEQGFVNEFDNIDGEAYHALLSSGEKAIATGRLFKEHGEWHIGRVAVIKECRGKELGRKIIELLESKAAELGAQEVGLSAQVRVKGFYEKLGYQASGEEYLDEYCPHITMKKKIGQNCVK